MRDVYQRDGECRIMVYLWLLIYYGIGRRLCGGAALGYLKRVVFEFKLEFYPCFTLIEVEITVRGWEKNKETNQKKCNLLLIATHISAFPSSSRPKEGSRESLILQCMSL